MEQFKDQIVRSCSVWNEEDARKRWPRPAVDEVREYKAIVWLKDDPLKPRQRVELHARGVDEATEMLKEMFSGTEIEYSLWNEEEANRIR